MGRRQRGGRRTKGGFLVGRIGHNFTSKSKKALSKRHVVLKHAKSGILVLKQKIL